MKKKNILIIAIVLSFAVLYCDAKSEKINPELIYGKWQIYTSPEDLKKLKTGMQKLFFVFRKDGTGVFYYYNVNYKSGTQSFRKDKKFKYEILPDRLKITWLENKQTVYWPYSLKEENKFLVLSDPTPGYAITYALQRVENNEE